MAMPYTHTAADGRAHYLHGKTVVFPDGRREPIYWFARAPQVGKTVATLPTGYRIKESPVTRRPTSGGRVTQALRGPRAPGSASGAVPVAVA
jgi:hypothetical protein